MVRKGGSTGRKSATRSRARYPSSLHDARVICCGDCLDQLQRLPDACIMSREDRTKGFFIAFDYSDDALREIDAFFRSSGKWIAPLAVREILDKELA